MTVNRIPGAVQHAGRGLDARCYGKSKRDGTLIDYPRQAWPAEERIEEWQFLRSSGVDIATAAARMGITRDGLSVAIRRHARRLEGEVAA